MSDFIQCLVQFKKAVLFFQNFWYSGRGINRFRFNWSSSALNWIHRVTDILLHYIRRINILKPTIFQEGPIIYMVRESKIFIAAIKSRKIFEIFYADKLDTLNIHFHSNFCNRANILKNSKQIGNYFPKVKYPTARKKSLSEA